MVGTIRTKILAVLAEASEPLDIQAIAEGTGAQVKSVSEALSRLNKDGKVDNPEKGFWQIKDEGRQELDKISEQEARSKELEQEPSKPHGEMETVPSQSDLFRSIGQNLGVGARKGDVRLDAIIYYVQRTANLDNLSSVWDALTDMGVANDVKKRWIKIYAQNLPGKEIPEELKEKLEGEPERIGVRAEGVSPKPKRFSVISGEIIGDPEGDYSFKEALQYVAQQKGASPNEAGSMALELSKLGPEMLTALLGAVAPLIDKESPRSDMDTILKLTEAGLLKKPGDEDAASPTIRALETQVKELTDEMRKRELDSLKGLVGNLSSQVTDLREHISKESKLEGRYALMDKTITTIDGQLTGFRSDARPVLDAFARSAGREPEPTRRSPEEKAKIAKGLKDAVVLEKEAHQLEDELLFGVKEG